MISSTQRIIMRPLLKRNLRLSSYSYSSLWTDSLPPSVVAFVPTKTYDPRSFPYRSCRLSTRLCSTAAEQQPITGGSLAVRSQKPTPLPTNNATTELQMLSFHHFELFPNDENNALLACRDSLFDAIKDIPGLRGTIHLALEGINAQLAVPPDEIQHLLQALCSLPFRLSFQDHPPNLGDVVSIDTPTFDRLIVRTRDYVLRDGMPSEISNALDWRDAGPELSPEEWHEELRLLPRDDDDESSSSSSSSSTTLLDCRNLYESDQGTFQGAIPLGTQTFQESWESLEERTQEIPRGEPVHIFCTGGIRCVKVGAYLKQQLGFSDVRRLQHGIIGYQQWMEEQQLDHAAEVDPTASLWEGENFLFDKRQSTDMEAKKGESSNE